MVAKHGTADWLMALMIAVGFGFCFQACAGDAAGTEFFEAKIRPLLVEHCYECHSAESKKGVKGGLRLDSRDGVLQGGDTGPALVPGNPDASLLIRAVRYQDDKLQMPPKNKKLPAEQIAALEAWVKMGAPDPRSGEIQNSKFRIQNSKEHWAFQPIRQPPLPTVNNQRWVQNPIDAFVLARLEAQHLTPSPAADRRTLFRRATYDLTGLPPTMAEVEAFLADRSPDAFAKIVERLLASPHYGERWARHWLDVARYADTKGYLPGDEQRRYGYSYTYRDYVVRAFNEDLSYDRFLVEQIAADLLPPGNDKRPLAALGFLTLGRRFLNNVPDIIDDRIDVITRGTMGLTVTCARCHDHKYDPIPTKDYYSLYGVFLNCHEPVEKPLLGIAPPAKLLEEYQAERRKRENDIKEHRETELAKARSEVRQRTGDYLLAAHEAKPVPPGELDKFADTRKVDEEVLKRWMRKLDGLKRKPHPILDPWFAFAALPEKDFTNSAKLLAARIVSTEGSGQPINSALKHLFATATNSPAALKDVAAIYNQLCAGVETNWQALAAAAVTSKAPAPAALPDANREAVRQLLYAPGSPAITTDADSERLLAAAAPRQRELKAKLDELDAIHPGSPPRAMALLDNDKLVEPVVFVRGNPGNIGPAVPRQFLEVITGKNRQPFQSGSGRLELARAITSPDNPLTARVLVNRVWLNHFGAGLVRTPSDFGVRAEPPTHPELLDYLAARFMVEGWSLKKLHRAIMLSATYQQSSEERAEGAARDPSNQWLWKMNRQRLGFEAMRDTLLAASGQLDLARGGHPVELTAEPFPARRTIYGLVDRQNLPGVFRTFDFASPDASSPQRFSTTVPQQSLFLMNSPFVIQQAQAMARRADLRVMKTDEERISRAHQILHQRQPSAEEIRAVKKFLDGERVRPAQTVANVGWRYGTGQLNATNGTLLKFEQFHIFTGKAWESEPTSAQSSHNQMRLDAEGGRVGVLQTVVRRWIAPRAGTVEIGGTLRFKGASCTAILGIIITNAAGKLGEWTSLNPTNITRLENVKVAEGDTIDFIVNASCPVERFNWSPQIKYTGKDINPENTNPTLNWNAKTDFNRAGRDQTQPLTSLEKLLQVLLLSNETVFVD
ncbi:MAG: DUF1553 domain-containing protein [Verrucomicrobia bacterium]|nr:DUF1553 domain-containing protein [Verrucomicrobiota bacterium]